MKATAIVFTLMAATATSETPAEPAMTPPKDAQTALARHPTETDTSAAATDPVFYVNISWLKYQIMFAKVYFSEKVECKN
ncbi:unnamed protein product [Penicillium viridicatum]